MQTLMKLEGITKVYGEGDLSVEALRGVNLEVGVGDYLAVMGPSGSGKSTLMHILGLLDTPTEGSYLLDCEEVAGFSRRKLAHLRNRKIGFIFQNFNCCPGRACCETWNCRFCMAAWAARSGASSHTRRWARSVWPTAGGTVQTSSRAVSGNVAPSLGQSSDAHR